ncbi:unnamed protein product [Bemisia tabaci]|uniref:Ionotropic receptor n=1 Tax=Bemisia tabaci TaxID=7038 RepID=A0A9P0A4B4_BEMTA|nr:unnamed protein product [Bemisia tabaci]
MCQAIGKRTELKLFYIVDIDSHLVSSHLIENLQTTSIQTILISHHSKVRSSVITDGPKNMIFILEDFQELFNLIFFTISQADLTEINKEIVTGLGNNKSHPGCQLKETLPRYCIKVDGHYLWSGNRKACSKVVSITSSELEDRSVLSDKVFNATRDLYFNKIWNCRNHLIFVLKNVQHNTRTIEPKYFTDDTLKESVSGSLIFCFKFFWRFFKGRNTVICYPGSCEKYDAFTGNVISYRNDTLETFLDFSWKNLHGKTLEVSIGFLRDTDLRISTRPYWSDFVDFYWEVLYNFERSGNCVLRRPTSNKDFFLIEDGLRFGIDFLVFDTGIVLEETDVSKFDFSVSIHTSRLCIATPHSGFMSQGLVIFKSFTPTVWILACIAIGIFVSIHYIFLYLQCESFRRLYSVAEIDYYRNASSLLIIYAFFICGSPPSLHLGRLITGKILFVIFSFAAMILSTVFLGGMTTLLSNRVMYPEIDSLETLETSDHFIQTFSDLDGDMLTYISKSNQSETMKVKFINSLSYYIDLYFDSLGPLVWNSTVSSFFHDFHQMHEGQQGKVLKKLQKTIRLTAERDALLLSLPFSSTPKKNVRIKFLPLHDDEMPEYHLMGKKLNDVSADVLIS